MSFFQNPLSQEFRGNLVLGDRKQALEFICPRNAGRGDEVVYSWKTGPFNLSGNDADGNATKNLTLQYSTDALGFKNWASVVVDITAGAANSAAVMPTEVVAALNNNASFTAHFTASLQPYKDSTYTNTDGTTRIIIKSNLPVTRFHFYVVSGGADAVVGFNARAGVAELPTYFTRHTIANANTYTDSVGMLVLLNPSTSNVDAATIDNAVDPKGNSLGYNHGTVQADYQLFAGRSGMFQFTKNTVDTSNRITTQIQYSSGAKVGDLAVKTTYSYSSTNTTPSLVAQVPYTLTSGDLITPP